MVSLYITGVGRVGHGRDAVLLRVRDGEFGEAQPLWLLADCCPTVV